jgi:20S proteasome alpha/beta subunit
MDERDERRSVGEDAGSLLEGSDLTLAMGLVCADGIVLAADRRTALPDGLVTSEVTPKLHAAGEFVIAHAGDDSGVARTLVRWVREHFERNAPPP